MRHRKPRATMSMQIQPLHLSFVFPHTNAPRPGRGGPFGGRRLSDRVGHRLVIRRPARVAQPTAPARDGEPLRGPRGSFDAARTDRPDQAVLPHHAIPKKHEFPTHRLLVPFFCLLSHTNAPRPGRGGPFGGRRLSDRVGHRLVIRRPARVAQPTAPARDGEPLRGPRGSFGAPRTDRPDQAAFPHSSNSFRFNSKKIQSND